MAFFLNEMEIEEAVEITSHRSPEHYPYVKYLSDWKDIVNDHSDGWAYWKGGHSAARKLAMLVQQTVHAVRLGRGEAPDPAEMRKALGSIKAAATRHDLPCPELEPAPTQGFGMRGF